jgi:hypothetical protein
VRKRVIRRKRDYEILWETVTVFKPIFYFGWSPENGDFGFEKTYFPPNGRLFLIKFENSPLVLPHLNIIISDPYVKTGGLADCFMDRPFD